MTFTIFNTDYIYKNNNNNKKVGYRCRILLNLQERVRSNTRLGFSSKKKILG